MRMFCWLSLTFASALLVGCGASPEPTPMASSAGKTKVVDEAVIQANLAKLDKDDRADAEAQRLAVHGDSRLGSMGVPVRIKVKDGKGEERDVYLCCKGCEKEARADEAKTAARALELDIKANLAKLSPEDRKAAEAQRFCVTDVDSRLGAMGVPPKVMLKDKDGQEHPVFVCCGGCAKEAKKDPEKTLAHVEEMKKKYAAEKDKKE